MCTRAFVHACVCLCTLLSYLYSVQKRKRNVFECDVSGPVSQNVSAAQRHHLCAGGEKKTQTLKKAKTTKTKTNTNTNTKQKTNKQTNKKQTNK